MRPSRIRWTAAVVLGTAALSSSHAAPLTQERRVDETFYDSGAISSRTPYVNELWHGTYQAFYEDGQLSLEIQGREGQRAGRYVRYHEDGTVAYRGTYSGGGIANYTGPTAIGVHRSFYPSGAPQSVVPYNLSGSWHGTYLAYHENGVLGAEIEGRDGERSGKFVSYFEDGAVRYVGTYQGGGIQNYTGPTPMGVHRSYYENGHLAEVTPYENGIWEGTSLTYHESGWPAIYSEGIGGLKHGAYATCHDGAGPWEIGRYEQNLAIGRWVTLDQDGAVTSVKDCPNGECAEVAGDWDDAAFDEPFDPRRFGLDLDPDDRDGPLAFCRAVPDDRPSIVEVLVLDRQLQVRDGIASYGYPTGNGVSENRTRSLLVIGRNLPQEIGEQVNMSADDVSIGYTLLGFPDTDNLHYQQLYQEGWDAAEEKGFAESAGFEALLVRANLELGVRPSSKTLFLNGADGTWPLLFGDVRATVRFVREDGRLGLEPIQAIYHPERVFLEVVTSVPLEVSDIPVYVSDRQETLHRGAGRRLTASRTGLEGDRHYLTPPIDIVDAADATRAPPTPGEGATVIPVRLTGGGEETLWAKIDEMFELGSFLMPIRPRVLSVPISVHPEGVLRSELWKAALNATSVCEGRTGDDWETMAGETADVVTNRVLFSGIFNPTRRDPERSWWDRFFGGEHTMSTEVKFGQRAAAIMLRDEFVSMLGVQLRNVRRIRGNPVAVRGFLGELNRRAYEIGPIANIEVETIDGASMLFGDVVSRLEPRELASIYDTTPEAVAAWQLEQTGTALERLEEAIIETTEAASEAGDCETEDLLRLTGFGFDNVRANLVPRLMVLAEETTNQGVRRYWTPDEEARRWIDQVAPIAAQVRDQQRRASADTDLIAAALTVAAMPFTFAGGWARAMAAGLGALDFGSFIYREATQYADSWSEENIVEGGWTVLGPERYDQAREDARHWANTLANALEATLGVLFDADEYARWFRALSSRARAVHVARGAEVAAALTPESARTMSSADAEDLMAFGQDAVMRRALSEVDPLTPSEAEALDRTTDFMEGSDFGPIVADPVPAEDLPSSFKNLQGEGLPEPIPLGSRIGAGSFNQVIADGRDPERVLRVSRTPANSRIVRQEEIGRQAVEAIERSGDDRIRMVTRHEHYPEVRLPMDFFEEGRRIEVVDRVPTTAARQIRRNPGGDMTPGQAEAFDGGVRALEENGWAWLDAKPNNFAFEPLPGADRWRMLVLDSGGIVRAAGDTPAERLTNARYLQRLVHDPEAWPEEQAARFRALRNDWRYTVKRNQMRLHHLDGRVNLEAMEIDHMLELHSFMPSGVEAYPRASALTRAPTEQLPEALRQMRARYAAWFAEHHGSSEAIPLPPPPGR